MLGIACTTAQFKQRAGGGKGFVLNQGLPLELPIFIKVILLAPADILWIVSFAFIGAVMPDI
ncbi:MAG: hypothetical protein AAGA75_25990 [Cyanobacteria bacterium P01_E01_bin.6]